MPDFHLRRATAACAVLLLAACGKQGAPSSAAAPAPAAKPSAADAAQFIDKANAQLKELYAEGSSAGWVSQTYINDDTQLLNARANDRFLALQSTLIDESKKFNGVEMPAETKRAIELIKTGNPVPAPSDATKRSELSALATKLDGEYGAGKWCPPGKSGDDCMTLDQIEQIVDHWRDPKALAEAWAGWHSVGKPMKQDYARLAQLMDEGAVELGYKDAGELWRAGYDMTPEQFSAETERLWTQVQPLYEQLHCFVRGRLHARYGELVPSSGLIPADLLGNMWAQDWSNIYDLVDAVQTKALADARKNAGGKPLTTDQQAAAEQKARTQYAKDTAKVAEDFYTSIGFQALPASFWDKSMLTRPRDRDVVCHASAWDIDQAGDVRIKMCIKPDEESLETIHHELGHVYYFLHYNQLPELYQNKIAFLPFGKMIDQWRWQVFSGAAKPEGYNAAWWALREKYQGIVPPVARTEEDFDQGAKYHVPGNTPYTRYFLSFVIQFQFQKALCDAAGFTGPLYQCDVYNSKEAGKKFGDMLALGASKPW
ncbi:MAG: M2 family metallopeptidase, partial [Lysobacter sp.]|nr:M2 family metallopeptidase [Lysobacter sp.]